MVSGSWCSKYDPTNSHVSAPSNEPIVTSNEFDEFFLVHTMLPLYRRDCFACHIISFSWAGISVCASANLRASSSSLDEIEG